jgi:hypothetical protein
MTSRVSRREQPTLWQLIVDVEQRAISGRDAYRMIRALMRAAQRQRMTQRTKGTKT